MTSADEAGDRALSWGHRIIGRLVALGVDEVELVPGSRSTPLVLAAHAAPSLKVRVHLDERSAGFFALGYARRSRRPGVVITTSGTAVANLLPAVVEASASDVPLLLVTADRPPTVRDRDANQTIHQPGIFGRFCRHGVDLALPSGEGLDRGEPDEAAERAYGEALGPPAGPVHLNVPLAKPLHPESPAPAEGLDPSSRRSAATPGVTEPAASDRAAEALTDALSGARRPLLVAGPSTDPDRDGPALFDMARRLGIPVLADPLSGARFLSDGGDVVLGAYDHFLRTREVVDRLAPDVIVRTGRTPTSSALERALESWVAARQIVLDAGSLEKDHQGLADLYLRATPAHALPAVQGIPVPGSWLDRWRRVEDATWSAVEDGRRLDGHEGAVLAEALAATPPGATFFVSSSMPVRDLDGHGRPGRGPARVFGNRGASGIDGIVSTALGTSAGGGEPVVTVLGDLAFLHDVGGLLAARDPSLRVVFVVIDNDGGGIFHLLPVRAFEPAFTPYFATPHGLDLRHAARLYGVGFEDVGTASEVGPAVRAGVERGGVHVVRIRTDRETNRAAHEETERLVLRRLSEIPDEDPR